MVHRLREVSCLYGFTRFEAAPTATDGDIEDVNLAVHGAPVARDADWLPASEQFGEGLFIHCDEGVIARGSLTEPVRVTTSLQPDTAIGPSASELRRRNIRRHPTFSSQPGARLDDGNRDRLRLPGELA